MEGHWRVGQVSQQSHILLVWTFFSQIIITTPATSNRERERDLHPFQPRRADAGCPEAKT